MFPSKLKLKLNGRYNGVRAKAQTATHNQLETIHGKKKKEEKGDLINVTRLENEQDRAQ